jgi:DNA-binding NarL/FixJ family response regulator
MQVFLVEDSPLVRTRLHDLVGAVPGAQVVGEAGTADSAIRDILALRPDVVLLDINLAEGSGFDVLRAVCRQAPAVDFYVLSNFSADPYRQLAERLGARGFFDKSKDIERVHHMMKARAANAKGETPCPQ